MGLPFNLYFALLAIGQFGTLTLVAVNYWEHQNLRVQIDSIAKGSIEHRESGLKVARKPDYPGDPDSSGAIREGAVPSKKPEIGLARGIETTANSDSLGWQSLAILLGVLLFFLAGGFLWQQWQSRDFGTTSAGSPVSKQQLAHRQLAELRLRRHGFGQ